METKFFTHIPALITQARLKMGYATLRELYREKKPLIDYQTWLSAESGRRIPSAKLIIVIGDILSIDREALIIAYCKDKFDDPISLSMLESLQYKRLLGVDSLIEAKTHERNDDYFFSAEEIVELKKDPRLRLFLSFTYDPERRTTFSRLAACFKIPQSDVKPVIEKLESMKLVEVRGEEIKKVHPHSSLPDTPDLFNLRRELLLQGLRISLRPESYILNYFMDLTEESFNKVCSFMDFIGANLVQMARTDTEKENKSRFQITLTGSKLIDISDESENNS